MASVDFNDTNGTPVETHDANITATTNSSGSGGEIQSNHYRESGDWNLSYYYYSGGDADTSIINVNAGVTPSGHIGPSCRMPTNERGYQARFYMTAGTWNNVDTNKDGSWLASDAISYSNSVSREFKITTSGTTTVTIKAFVDNTEEASYDDSSTPLSGGAPGWVSSPYGTAADSDFDDWSDGAGGTSKQHNLLLGVG